MPDFNDLTLLPFCAGLTLIGLIASWAAWRRRGVTAGVRGVAWSLLPVSLYLTGLLELVWDVVQSTTELGHAPDLLAVVWAGVALFGVSVVLFVVSGSCARGRAGTGTEGKRKAKPASSAGELTRRPTHVGPPPKRQARQGAEGEAAGIVGVRRDRRHPEAPWNQLTEALIS